MIRLVVYKPVAVKMKLLIIIELYNFLNALNSRFCELTLALNGCK